MDLNIHASTPVMVFVHCDHDGFAGGAIVKYKYPQAHVASVNYSKRIDTSRIMPDSVIFIVDLTLPIELFLQLRERHRIIWIDHHKQSYDTYATDPRTKDLVIEGIREDHHSACWLTWKFIFPEVMTPKALEWISDLDLWQLQLKDSLTFYFGAQALRDIYPSERNMLLWTRMLNNDPGLIRHILNNGAPLRDSYQRLWRWMCSDTSYTTEMDGMPILAANANFANSLGFESTFDPTIHKAMVRYVLTNMQSPEGAPIYRCSIYTNDPDLNVAEVAQKYGGSGQKGAAGWTCTKLPFEQKSNPKFTPIYFNLYPYLTEDMRRSNPFSLSLQKDWKMLSKSTAIYGALEGLSYVAINSVVPLIDLFQAANIGTVDVAIAWAWTSCGMYRYVMHPMSAEVNLTPFKDRYNGQFMRHSNTLIIYSKDRLIP